MGFLAFANSTATAQDALKAAPNNQKLLVDSDGVRMIKGWLKPGEVLPMHSHPFYEVYVLSGGEITATNADGTKKVLTYKTGDAYAAHSVTHTIKNTGKTTVEFILVEVKDKK
ncbi:MAG: cupin domain-containing protein [Chitinophagales bacterium]